MSRQQKLIFERLSSLETPWNWSRLGGNGVTKILKHELETFRGADCSDSTVHIQLYNLFLYKLDFKKLDDEAHLKPQSTPVNSISFTWIGDRSFRYELKQWKLPSMIILSTNLLCSYTWILQLLACQLIPGNKALRSNRATQRTDSSKILYK